MQVLLLSDFSEVAINATHYAMDLLKDEKVSFTLLNIYVPDPMATEKEKAEKRKATVSRLQERVEKLRERAQGRDHRVNGHYAEENLVNATRDFLVKTPVDLLVMGAVSNEKRHSTILGDHTFEIISKIKCNLLAVPEEVKFREIHKVLMPVDFSANLSGRNFHFLQKSRFLKNTHLSVWDLGSTENNSETEAYKNLKELGADFFKPEEGESFDKSTWTDLQKKFDVISIVAKNLRICSHIMHSKHGFYLSAPNRLPIFVLHN